MKTARQPSCDDRKHRQVILLVEDEPFVREATCRTLESAGFEVLAVADSGERMPHKSTYFYPKPLTGLVMNVFED